MKVKIEDDIETVEDLLNFLNKQLEFNKIEKKIVETAIDLVALWKNPVISDLPRNERNSAIEDVRKTLINLVSEYENMKEPAIES
jgi:hypothetical protein